MGETRTRFFSAALLYYPSVEGETNPDELPKFEAKDERWKRVVCKRYNVSRLEKLNDGYTRLMREIEFGRFHCHENIVKYYEAFPEFDGTTKITHYWLVSERMDYNMEQYFGMQDYKKLERKIFLYLIGSFLAQLLRGLDYLHQNGIIHRNIEPKHIGYNQHQHRSQLKILNFGLSRPINLNDDDYSTTVDAPLRYEAIEMLVKVKYNTKIDIWAAALVTIEWLGEKLFQPPGSDEEIREKTKKLGPTRIVLNRILDILGVPDDYYQSIFGKELRCLKRPNKLTEELERLCKKSNLQYVNVVDVGLLDVEGFCDLLRKMLNPDQEARPSAEQCLEHPFLQGLNKKLQTHALDRQPTNDEEMKDRNQKHKELLNKQLMSGYTRLSF